MLVFHAFWQKNIEECMKIPFWRAQSKFWRAACISMDSLRKEDTICTISEPLRSKTCENSFLRGQMRNFRIWKFKKIHFSKSPFFTMFFMHHMVNKCCLEVNRCWISGKFEKIVQIEINFWSSNVDLLQILHAQKVQQKATKRSALQITFKNWAQW